MKRGELTAAEFGRRVVGPIVGEFCLRLWSLGRLLPSENEAVMLFCARGGLRMQLAYETFLTSAQLPPPLPIKPFMVSRVVAIRPALLRTVQESLQSVPPWAASTIAYEFRTASVAQVARTITGVQIPHESRWSAEVSAAGLAALLHHRDGEEVVDALTRQSALFSRHLTDALDGRRHGLLVDTGLYGTTRQLLAEGLPHIDFDCALLARSHRPGPADARPGTFGLSVEGNGYSPLARRSAVFRYWHFIEWLFEPELPSVTKFGEVDGAVRSNLEVDGWQQRIRPAAGSVFAGVLAYLGELTAQPAAQLTVDADRAWDEFRRAVVWPQRGHGRALQVGLRTHDFGIDRTWAQRSWTGPVNALRGSSMWREGEIARSTGFLRMPLLALVESAYNGRLVTRRLRKALGRS